MNKKNKKAFTVVELVIVIAVIAILAAVLIAIFANMIKKANESADMQLIRNLNTALATDSILNGKHGSMQSALDAAEKSGYIIERINASATQNEIVWDSKNDMFCYLKEDGTIEYLPDSNTKYQRNTGETYDPEKVNDIDYFVISSTINEKYSTYLYNYAGSSTLEVTKGLDVGKVTSITSITYNGSATGQTVIIRTNNYGTTLTVNAPNDTVNHYDKAGKVHIISVNPTHSYHENGKIVYMDVAAGHVVFESTAEVDILYCTANSGVSFELIAGAVVRHAHTTSLELKNALDNASINIVWDYDGDGSGNHPDGGTWNPEETVQNTINGRLNNELTENPEYVARIGGTGYVTLEAAVADAVNGDTIVLLKDVSTDNGTYGTSNYINISKTITLDLAGHGVTNNKSVGFFMPATATVGGVVFTIDDNSNNKTGYIISSKSHGIQVGSKNYIVVNNGRIEGIGSGIQASQYCSVTINDGVVKSNHTGNSYYAGIYSSHYDVSVTINGGTVIGKRAVWVGYSGDSLTVNGGTIDGTTYGVTASNGATVVVNDGTIKATGAVLANYGIFVNGPTSSLTVNGGTITAKIKSVQASYAAVNIAGGTFRATGYNAGANDSYALLLYGTTTTITGGKFVNDNAWTTSGKYQYGIFFANVQDANKVVTNGSLSVKDVDITATQTGIYFSTNAECIIKDCNITAMESIFLANSNAVCTVDGGNYNSNGSQVLYAQTGFFNVIDGTFTGSGSTNVEDHIYRYTLNCLDSSFSADPATAGFTVTGGSFYQFNPENDLSEGANTCFTPEGYHTEYNESTGYYTVVANN